MMDLEAGIRDLGGQIFGIGKTNLKAAWDKISEDDRDLIARLSTRKGELLLASALGMDTTDDEKIVDVAIEQLEAEIAAILRDTFKQTILQTVTVAGKVVFKIVLSALPIP
jgi:hypothetical protein